MLQIAGVGTLLGLHWMLFYASIKASNMSIAGLVCIFSFDSRYRTGIIIGIISAAVCSLYAISNKKVSAGIRSVHVADNGAQTLAECIAHLFLNI